MAQTAATLDDISGGRFRLGLGTGHRVTMSGWHGLEIGKPLAEMREYVSVVRALLAGRQYTTGRRWNSQFGFVGFSPRADIPIYLAGLSPGMIRLAAEIADGVVLWACPASYVQDVVVPEVVKTREAVGKDVSSFDIVASIPAAATEDTAAAHAGIRAELHRYFGLPFYRAMFDSAGYGADIAAYDTAAGDIARQLEAIGDEFIEDLCAIGDAAAVRKSMDRYFAAGATNLMITNIRGTAFEPTMRAAVG
jgi:alkanesulfonate monooxygenase SsuD/methylene tetrahydromethanopterin reductase-like flavin-dependent oxidoreductase (luciferase family)